MSNFRYVSKTVTQPGERRGLAAAAAPTERGLLLWLGQSAAAVALDGRAAKSPWRRQMTR